MAGDWIKMRCTLWEDPHVVRLESILKKDRAAIIGWLYRLWILADQHTVDGRLAGYTAKALDDAVGMKGFAKAVATVGWLTVEKDGLVLPRFDEHNGASAKKRAQGSRRVTKHRKKGATRVTQ